jgi:hypothetical protein
MLDFSIEANMGRTADDELHFDRPPRGVSMKQTPEGGTVIRVLLRSIAGAGFLLVFTVFWNGLLSVFLALAIQETARRFGWAVPDWLPMGGGKWEGGHAPPLLFLWLFLTPFICVGAGTAFAVFFSLFGHCAVRLEGDAGSVFTGIGALGRTQRFAPASVKTVHTGVTHNSKGADREYVVIEMNNGRKIKLPVINGIKRTWLIFALQKLLNRKGG